MQAVNGRDCSLSVRSGSPDGALLPLEGASLTGFDLNSIVVDVTDGEGNGWRTLLSQAGERQVKVEASGIHLGGPAELRVREIALTGGAEEFELTLGGSHKLRADFIVERLKYEALQEDELSFRLALVSAGPVTLV